MKLIDVCVFIVDCPHSTAKDEGRGIPLVRTPNIGKGRLELNGVHRVNETVYNQRVERAIPEAGDLILAREAPVGNVALLLPGQKVCLGQRVVLIRPDKEKADAAYLMYYLLSDKVQRRMKNNANGAVVAHLNMNEIRNLEIDLPDLSEQKRIASVLSSLDDKITLNNRINHNLEEQAKALYKSWFVDFEPFTDGEFEDSELGMIPVGWNVKKIGALPLYIADYVANGSFASLKENVRLYESENYAVFVRNTDLKSGTFPIFVDAHSYNFLSKTKLKGGEIIISNVGDVGSVHFCPRLNRPMTLGNNVIMIKAEERHYYSFLYLCFKYFSGHYSIEGITGGSAMPKFNKTDFKGIQLIIPSSDILSRFDEITSSLFHRIEVNKRECEELSSQRDTLLPALMSGQLTC